LSTEKEDDHDLKKDIIEVGWPVVGNDYFPHIDHL